MKPLKQTTKDYLDATWRRLAHEYLRKENFDPNTGGGHGVEGVLLAGQLRLREAAPLLRKIAATDRFEYWAAPRLHGGPDSNLQALAREAMKEIE